MNDTDSSSGYDIVSVRSVAQLRLAEYRYHPHATHSLHSHDTDHAYFVISGASSETDQHETFIADSGMFVFHPRGDKHSNITSPDGLQVFGIEIEPSWRERIQTYGRFLERPYHIQGGPSQVHALKLYREFREPDVLSSLVIEGLMLELLVEVARGSGPALERRVPLWLRQVRERLDSQFAEGRTIEDIARFADVHPVYLARTFRKHYHCTVGEYVRQQRIQYACRLIATSHYSLGEIALEVGFSDQAHFSRAFKRITGLTPAKFRASVKTG